jgi:hypothetical protein
VNDLVGARYLANDLIIGFRGDNGVTVTFFFGTVSRLLFKNSKMFRRVG